MNRYQQLAKAFVGLADSLVADYDVVELAQQLVDSAMRLLPVAAASPFLADPRGELHVLASSSEQTGLQELFQVQAGVGPCLQAYRGGQAVLVDDLKADGDRWPQFAVSVHFQQLFRAAPPVDESAVSVPWAHSEGLVELVHKEGWVVRAKMSKSVVMRADDPVLVTFQDLTEQRWAGEP